MIPSGKENIKFKVINFNEPRNIIKISNEEYEILHRIVENWNMVLDAMKQTS